MYRVYLMIELTFCRIRLFWRIVESSKCWFKTHFLKYAESQLFMQTSYSWGVVRMEIYIFFLLDVSLFKEPEFLIWWLMLLKEHAHCRHGFNLNYFINLCALPYKLLPLTRYRLDKDVWKWVNFKISKKSQRALFRFLYTLNQFITFVENQLTT